MFGYTTIFVTACLITVGSAKGTRCRKCFDFGGKFFLHSHSTKNCEKPSSSECATSNYTCMEFVGTLDIKIILTTSMNITTRYCAVTNQTGCQKIDFADPNHDPTGIISEITTGMKKIPKLSTLFSIQNISGSVCVSGSKPEKKAITEVHSVSIASTPGSSIVSRITTDTTKIPDMSSVHSKNKLSGSVSVSRITTGINSKPGISPAVSNDKHSGSVAIISHGWQAMILILLINILLMLI